MTDLLENVPCGILVFEDEGRIVSANETLRALLGYSADELAAVKIDALLTTSSRIFHQTHFHPMLRLHGRADEIYLTLRTKSGEAAPFLANAVRRQTGGATLITCALMPAHRREQFEKELVEARNRAEEALRSNEELRRAQEELQQRLHELDRNLCEVGRRRGELLRLNEILSHDLREPVRKLAVFADLIQDHDQDVLSEDGRVAVEGICASSRRIQNLLRALQTYLSVDRIDENLQQSNLTDVSRVALSRVESAGIQIEVIAEDLPIICGFPRQLVALFETLFRNAALRRADRPLAIKIRCAIVQQNSFRQVAGQYRYADYARLVVADNSRGFQGLDPEAMFALLSKAGTGVALQTDLAICRKIAENHHGSITLASDTPDGAAFAILLPIKGAAES